MPVDVVYEGIVLARGVEPRIGGEGVFVPLPAPMPVGTRIRLQRGDVRHGFQVLRVRETGEPGVFLTGEGGARIDFEALFPAAAAAVAAAAAAAATAAATDRAPASAGSAAPDESAPAPRGDTDPREIDDEAGGDAAGAPAAADGDGHARGRRQRRGGKAR